MIKRDSIGEYESIINHVKKTNYLILAQCTPCSQKEAIKIVKKTSKIYYKNEKVILCLFDCKRGLGGTIFYKEYWRPYIRLPKCRMYHPCKWKGKLRIGLVLHELAHAITDYKNKVNNSHGKAFLNTYDKLLKLYYKNVI